MTALTPRELRKASDYGHVRWPGRPTTGRYVHRDAPRQWSWQCDLHEISHGSWHTFPTMQEAFENAMIHARECKPDYLKSA